MKGIIAGSILAVVVAFCIISHLTVLNGIRAMERRIEDIVTAVDNQDWQAAEEKMSAVTRRWERMRGFYSLFGRHQRYEAVALGMGSLPSLIDAQESDAYATAIRLREELALWRDVERFGLRNVL